MVVLAGITMVLLCVTLYGTFVMLCMRNWPLFGMGICVLLGIALLVMIVAFIYWAIDLLICRAELRAEIEIAISTQDLANKECLEARLQDEKWGDVFEMSATTLFVIAVYAVLIPIFLVVDGSDALCNVIGNKFSTT